ncbi:pre-mRNA-processing protein prp40 [Histoplasma capsulatum]|uniref:Pre-mRNA-processing protein prp40 n=1 Tax=Ajellomyces capsulatus TaxID=5037 RepID=A0A8A1M854_AJECA|nr:pre-mRNA-processing protein prp40 [Histoplasma capsulatum]
MNTAHSRRTTCVASPSIKSSAASKTKKKTQNASGIAPAVVVNITIVQIAQIVTEAAIAMHTMAATGTAVSDAEARALAASATHQNRTPTKRTGAKHKPTARDPTGKPVDSPHRPDGSETANVIAIAIATGPGIEIETATGTESGIGPAAVHCLATMTATGVRGRMSVSGCIDPARTRGVVGTSWIMAVATVVLLATRRRGVPRERLLVNAGGVGIVRRIALEVGARSGIGGMGQWRAAGGGLGGIGIEIEIESGRSGSGSGSGSGEGGKGSAFR